MVKYNESKIVYDELINKCDTIIEVIEYLLNYMGLDMPEQGHGMISFVKMTKFSNLVKIAIDPYKNEIYVYIGRDDIFYKELDGKDIKGEIEGMRQYNKIRTPSGGYNQAFDYCGCIRIIKHMTVDNVYNYTAEYIE